MGRNAQRKRIGNPKRVRQWAIKHRRALIATTMLRLQLDRARAEEAVDRYLAGPQARRPMTLGAAFKALLLSIPLVAALVKVRRD